MKISKTDSIINHTLGIALSVSAACISMELNAQELTNESKLAILEFLSGNELSNKMIGLLEKGSIKDLTHEEIEAINKLEVSAASPLSNRASEFKME